VCVHVYFRPQIYIIAFLHIFENIYADMYV